MKTRVLFLCTGNSCRSQMAEGWLRHLAGDRFDVVSAGTHPVGVNPYAVTVMSEAGVDISHHVSERVDPYLNQPFDYVITVCDHAQETCPVFPGAATKLHWSFEDPAEATGSYEQKLIVFRKTRDEIADTIRYFISQRLTLQRMGEAEQFGVALHNLVNETEVLASDRNRAAGAVFFIAQEHHHSIVVLFKYTFYSSGFTLLRSLFEAYLRGLWLKYCATDAQVKEFIEGGEPPKTMIAEIEAIPGFEAKTLSRIKKDAWKTMCAYTHTGGLHLLRWQTPDAVEPNFAIDELEECLNFAELFGALSALEFLQMSKSGNTGEAIIELMEKRWPSSTP